MEQRPLSPQFLQRRKFMLILPLFVVPFLIVLFMLFGGGTTSGSKAPGTETAKGINLKLPDAYFKKGKEKTKLNLYEEASKDSALLEEKIKNDPYYQMEPRGLEADGEKTNSKDQPVGNSTGGTHELSNPFLKTGLPGQSADSNEEKIMQKLAQLKSVIGEKSNDVTGPGFSSPIPNGQYPALPPGTNTEQTEKLLSSKATGGHDPEIDQLSQMLDKVMAIQHPELIRDSVAKTIAEQRQPAFAVSLNKESGEPVLFGNGDNQAETEKSNRFYDLAADPKMENEEDNTIEAVVPETQTLVSGSTVRLRLLNDIRINGRLIKKNQLIYGTASLSNERMKIQFSSIRSGNSILPVSLEAFDLDGLVGIYIPGSMNRDIAKQSGDQAINSLGLSTLDPSVGAQAAGAGIQAAKTLFSRKVKLIKVTIKAGHKVLLKENNHKNYSNQ